MRSRQIWCRRSSRALPLSIHGGPFANIACTAVTSVSATTTALKKLAGLRCHRGGFRRRSRRRKVHLDIKCRKAGLKPDWVVIVATIRALKMHGGVKKEDLKKENLQALEAGMANLQRHVENIKKYNLPAVVSINRFSSDTDAEINLVKEKCKALGVEALMARSRCWAMGGEGAADVAARSGQKVIDEGKADLKYLYPDWRCRCSKRCARSRKRFTAPTTQLRRQIGKGSAQDLGRNMELREAAGLLSQRREYSFSTNPDRQGRADRLQHSCA